MDQQPQYETISRFDRAYAGLKGGNNLETKAATIENSNTITGETETFIVQTIRTTSGDYVVIKYLDKEGHKRLILPPKVAALIERQHSALTDRARSNSAKAQAKERKLRGEVPGFMRKKVAAQ
jgi:hypothetical protein